MKKYLLFLLAACFLLAGCVTKNPAFDSSAPPSVDNPAYVPATNKTDLLLAKIHTQLDRAASLNAASAPLNPYVAPIDTGLKTTRTVVDGIFGAIALAGVVAASIKNKLANRRGKALVTLARADTNEAAIANAPDAGVAAEISAAHYEAAEVKPAS